VEGRCHSSNAGNSISSPSGTGNYCYCRARTSNGALSSWGYNDGDGGSNCASYCGPGCANTGDFSADWGARAVW
jgi:hypothetical protein